MCKLFLEHCSFNFLTCKQLQLISLSLNKYITLQDFDTSTSLKQNVFNGYCTTFLTCGRSYLPRTHFSCTPGQSCTRPPRTRTIWCSCKLCPIPGTYATASRPVLRRTLTHFLLAEFGFFGFLITVFSTTPFRKGRPSVALLRFRIFFGRPSRCILLMYLLTELSNDGCGNGLITFCALQRTLSSTGDILQWDIKPLKPLSGAAGAGVNDECAKDGIAILKAEEYKPLLNPTKHHRNTINR